jgi:Tol biopolymer transport system component
VPLTPGSRLGHYEILAKVGEGGMGEVYRARDSRLNRDVAIKVIHTDVLADPDRLARFRREAELLASLNHPGIAHVYGVEISDAGPAMVMELVEGSSLAELIQTGPFPVDEALAIARQIADALDTAHERGIVHRDLKPANVVVSDAGTVKVLDFGLAKAIGSESVVSTDAGNSPTLTARATAMGVILGTAAYMSPEQAKGRAVDRRTDIWAFGVVLFEMLSGRRAFNGDNVSDALASVLRDPPAWDALPAAVPPAVRRLLQRCLEKDPKRRLRDISEGMLQLDEGLAAAANTSPATSPTTAWRRAWPVAAAIVLTALVAWLFSWIKSDTTDADTRQVRLTAALPLLSNLRSAPITVLAISPDGRQLAYVARDPAKPSSQLYLRSVDQFDAQPVPGTEIGIASPFFSPDSKWLGFVTQERKVLKILLATGARSEVATLPAFPLGAPVWGADNRIVVGTTDGLFTVPGDGGNAESLTARDRSRGETGHGYPTLVGDTGLVIFTVVTIESDDSRLAAYSFETKKLTDLGPGSQPQYLASGHIAHVHGDRAIRVAPFDSRAVSLGTPVSVVPNVRFRGTAADYVVSNTGTLAYVLGDATTNDRTLVWVDRKGGETPVDGAVPRAYAIPRISPDETRIALDIDDRDEDIEIWNMALRQMVRLTTEKGQDNHPLWTPDGSRIVHTSVRGQQYTVHRRNADGSGQPETLFSMNGGTGTSAYALLSDNSGILLRIDRDLGLLRPGASAAPQLFFKDTTFSKGIASFSPDERFMVYHSNESGREPPSHVYVRPFPDEQKQRWQISSLRGGRDAVFSRDGKEIFYLEYDFWMMSAPVTTQPTFSHQAPTRLFPASQYFRRGTGRSFDVTKDGRFLMIKEPLSAQRPPETDVRIVLNWLNEVQSRVPGK